MEVCICVIFIVVLLSSSLFLTKRQKAMLVEFQCILHLSCYRAKLGSTCPHVVKPTIAEKESAEFIAGAKQGVQGSQCLKDLNSLLGINTTISFITTLASVHGLYFLRASGPQFDSVTVFSGDCYKTLQTLMNVTVISPTVNRHKLLLSISGPYGSTEVYLYPKGPRLRISLLRDFRIRPRQAHGLMVQ